MKHRKTGTVELAASCNLSNRIVDTQFAAAASAVDEVGLAEDGAGQGNLKF